MPTRPAAMSMETSPRYRASRTRKFDRSFQTFGVAEEKAKSRNCPARKNTTCARFLILQEPAAEAWRSLGERKGKAEAELWACRADLLLLSLWLPPLPWPSLRRQLWPWPQLWLSRRPNARPPP